MRLPMPDPRRSDNTAVLLELLAVVVAVVGLVGGVFAARQPDELGNPGFSWTVLLSWVLVVLVVDALLLGLAGVLKHVAWQTQQLADLVDWSRPARPVAGAPGGPPAQHWTDREGA